MLMMVERTHDIQNEAVVNLRTQAVVKTREAGVTEHIYDLTRLGRDGIERSSLPLVVAEGIART